MHEQTSVSTGNKSILDKTVSNIVDTIFSENYKTVRWVLLLTFIGFILRLRAALNLGVLADDMVYASQSAGIIAAKLVASHSNPALFFYLTDFAYKIFGFTTFASRFFPLMMGTMLIPLSFLISREFFDEKVSLFTALFVTLSSFLIRNTFTEASLVVLVFIFSGVYFGILHLKHKKMLWLSLSAISFGLGILTKYNTPFFILAFLVFAVAYKKINHEEILSKQNLKFLLLFLLIISIFAFPIFSFNYSLYKEKGIVDVYFSRVIHLDKTQELYGGLAGQGVSFFQNFFKLSNYGNIALIYHSDILIFLFSLFGLILLFSKKEKNFIIFLLPMFIIPFILQSAGAPLQKHFVFFPLLFSIVAGYGLSKVFSSINKKWIKSIIILLIVLISIINFGTFYGTPKDFVYESPTSSLKSFINNHVGQNDLILFDDRIYTSEAFWLCTDHNLLSLGSFSEFYRYNENLSGQPKVSTKVYVIECASDDCGWGWVSTNQKLNQSSEDLIGIFKNSSQQLISIPDYSYSSNSEILGKKHEIQGFNVYELEIPLNPQLVQQTKYINSFYFVPYMYLNMNGYIFDYPASGIGAFFKWLSIRMIFLSMILSILLLICIKLMLLDSPNRKN